MRTACEVIIDLMPLVKDKVASQESEDLVIEHLKNCESCRIIFEKDTYEVNSNMNDQKIIGSIKKHIVLAIMIIMMIGAFIGMAINKNATTNNFPIIVAGTGIAVVGILLFKFDIIKNLNVRRFFLGRAIVTVIIFIGVAIYILFFNNN